MPKATPLRVAVAGCTGYIGTHCVALLERHPHVQLSRVMARSHAGERHCDVVPGSTVELRIDASLEPDSADVIFAALPHTVAAAHARSWLSASAVVIDMSADFRLRDVATYERWYGVRHPAADLCDEAVYGMTEINREPLARADLIAVPGCYPTAILAATWPAWQSGLIEPDIIVDAKSGVSGAGRSPQKGTSFAEVNESVHAYSVSGHRHKPEVLQTLAAGDGKPRLTFVPHLVPMTRGILATAYLRPRGGVTRGAIADAYTEFASHNPFVRHVSQPPATKHVAGTNVVAVHVAFQDSVAVVTAAIDNLVKGAAGQAVQDMNVRFGFDETAGLERPVLWP
jgi:N-acetyl-gamma-glutamyl-phosphate reductase